MITAAVVVSAVVTGAAGTVGSWMAQKVLQHHRRLFRLQHRVALLEASQ